jgi:hypothetical protein
VAFYLGLHFESEKRHPNFRKTRSPIVENPAWVKNGYLRTGSIYIFAGIGCSQALPMGLRKGKDLEAFWQVRPGPGGELGLGFGVAF